MNHHAGFSLGNIFFWKGNRYEAWYVFGENHMLHYPDYAGGDRH
jgi:hypothetical protein